LFEPDWSLLAARETRRTLHYTADAMELQAKYFSQNISAGVSRHCHQSGRTAFVWVERAGSPFHPDRGTTLVRVPEILVAVSKCALSAPKAHSIPARGDTPEIESNKQQESQRPDSLVCPACRVKADTTSHL